MQDTFKSAALQKEFADKGYVIIPGLIDAGDISNLLMTFQKFEKDISEPFHTSHFSKDMAYKTNVHNTIIEIVYPKVAAYLKSYVPAFGNFMIKKPTKDNFLQMHADWVYVDESKYKSVSVWVPFVDTNPENGCLGVIEYSHKFMNSIRGPGIQQNYFKRDKIWVRKYGKLLSVKAGDAVVYDHGLLHFSPPNMSGHTRPALNLSLVPEGAEMIHYCIPEGAKDIEKYHVPDNDFFLDYDNWQRPRKGKMTEVLPGNTVKFIDGQMEAYGKNYQSLMQRMMGNIKTVFDKAEK